MMANGGFRKLAIVSVLMLGGCQIWIAGHTDDNGLVVQGTGTANPPARTSKFTLTIDGSPAKCDGNSHANPDGSRTDVVFINCDDGRKGEGTSHVVSADTGEGTGTDNCGNKYYLMFSINQEFIQGKLAEYRKASKASGNAGNDKCEAPGRLPPHTDPLI